MSLESLTSNIWGLTAMPIVASIGTLVGYTWVRLRKEGRRQKFLGKTFKKDKGNTKNKGNKKVREITIHIGVSNGRGTEKGPRKVGSNSKGFRGFRLA